MTTCLNCGKETMNPKFCSRSCAATFNRKGFKHKSESKLKISQSMKSKLNPYTKVDICVNCGKYFMQNTKRTRTTCSSKCLSNLRSNNTKRSILTNGFSNFRRGRNISRLEKSFQDWLTNNNINFCTEEPFYIKHKKQMYYCDFYFKQLKLVIELDGKQHLSPEAISYDKIKDYDILQEYGIYVYRISQDEYDTKSKLDIVKLMLLSNE